MAPKPQNTIAEWVNQIKFEGASETAVMITSELLGVGLLDAESANSLDDHLLWEVLKETKLSAFTRTVLIANKGILKWIVGDSLQVMSSSFAFQLANGDGVKFWVRAIISSTFFTILPVLSIAGANGSLSNDPDEQVSLWGELARLSPFCDVLHLLFWFSCFLYPKHRCHVPPDHHFILELRFKFQSKQTSKVVLFY